MNRRSNSRIEIEYDDWDDPPAVTVLTTTNERTQDGVIPDSAAQEEHSNNRYVYENDFDVDFDDDDDPTDNDRLPAGFSCRRDFEECRSAGFRSKAAYELSLSLGFPQGTRDIELRESEIGQKLLKAQRLAEQQLDQLENMREMQQVFVRNLKEDLSCYRATSLEQINSLSSRSKGIRELEKRVTYLRAEKLRLLQLKARIEAPDATYTPNQTQLHKIENLLELEADLCSAEEELDSARTRSLEAKGLSQITESNLEERRKAIFHAEAEAIELVNDIRLVEERIRKFKCGHSQIGGVVSGMGIDASEEASILQKRIEKLRMQEKVITMDAVKVRERQFGAQ